MVTTANLLAEYGLNPRPLTMPAVEAVLTKWPPSPRARIRGRRACTPWSTPIRLRPVVERNVVDAAAAGDAGIVADDVHVPERFE